MSPESDDMDLQELARTAGVTPRTIRYYVQQGLLPTPGRGPGTKYERALVDRLQLIKLFQRQHLPLAEIRNRLEELDDEGVRLALGSAPELPLTDTALGYVRSALAPQHSAREPQLSRFGKHTPLEDPQLVAAPLPIAAPESSPGNWQVTKSTWERVRLSRDVELNIRRPLSREQNKQVDDLIEAARKIFSEDR